MYKTHGELWRQVTAEEASEANLAEVVSSIKVQKISWDISGLSCASCAGWIEPTLTQTHNILQAGVNFPSYKAVIEYDL